MSTKGIDYACMFRRTFDVEDALGSNVFIAGAMQVELTEIAYIENWNWFIYIKNGANIYWYISLFNFEENVMKNI